MPVVHVTYENYVKNDLDNKLERLDSKLISKKGFGKKGSRVVSFNFLSPKACEKIAAKLKTIREVVDIEIEE